MTETNDTGPQNSPLDSLTEAASFEFDDVADYIWKTPRFIGAEYKREIAKLSDYYPAYSKAAKIRWSFEKHKLESLFPFLMAQANLFAATSIFEAYVLLLGSEIEKAANVELGTRDGRSVRQLLRSLNAIAISYSELPFWEQVDTALKLRNCLVHASGVISWSRQDAELRSVVSSGAFLTSDHRERQIRHHGKLVDVAIVPSRFGDRIVISNDYAYIATVYYRDYFLALCSLAARYLTRVLTDKDLEGGE